MSLPGSRGASVGVLLVIMAACSATQEADEPTGGASAATEVAPGGGAEPSRSAGNDAAPVSDGAEATGHDRQDPPELSAPARADLPVLDEKTVPEDIGLSTRSGVLVAELDNQVLGFAIDSAEPSPEGVATLAELADAVAEACEEPRLVVAGHASADGAAAEYNRRLSQRRAARVAELLADHDGLRRIDHEGHGADRPVADNATAEGRAANRRVEIEIRAC